jgi:hypothetical protein
MATPSLYHCVPSLVVDVRVTLPPAQKDVELPALITGVSGTGFTTTVIVAVPHTTNASVPVTV